MAQLLFSFKGRIGRKSYWMWFLFVFVGSLIAGAVDGAVFSSGGMGGVSLIFTLLILWPSLAIQVKRWHDRDKTGWWVLINLVPLIGALWALIENGFLSGTEGENRFGPNPVGGEQVAQAPASVS